MPRTRQMEGLASTVVDSLPSKQRSKGLVAAGVVVKPQDPTKRYKQIKPEGWQELVWVFYDTIGEFRYSVNWVGNILSRARLYVVDLTTGQPAKQPAVLAVLKELFGGPDYQKEMLRQLGIHFTAVGDSYLVASETIGWRIVPATALKEKGGNWYADNELLGPKGSTLVMRLWRPHPRDFQQPDSPSRPVLPILSEIDGLTRHVSAQIDSRLAGAGILFLPEEIDFSTSQATTEDDDEVATNSDSANDFARELMTNMNTAIANRESAEALTPMIVQVKGEYIKDVKHITFSTPLDQQSQSLRQEAIGRLALGMDMPPEVLTGTGDMNHWSSWQVEEAAIKAHSEPLLAIITSSLTEAYLTPALEGEGGIDPTNFAIIADTSQMRLRPNRSKEALELYDRGELDGDTLRVENGFDPVNGMQPLELQQWLLKKVAEGSPTPAMMIEALNLLGVPLPISAAAQIRDTVTEQVDANGDAIPPADDPKGKVAPKGSLEDHPARDLPNSDSIAAASEQIVFRALERIGAKLRRSREVARLAETYAASDIYMIAPYAAEDIPDLLDGAWSGIEACSLDINKDELTAILDSYVSGLLSTKLKHSPIFLKAYLNNPGIFKRLAA